jgi:hypothetical protein
MRDMTAFLFLFAATPALAGGEEYKIEFYLQPDSGGRGTLNKTVELDDRELTIEESRHDGNNRYLERDATDAEVRMIRRLVRERITQFEMEAGEEVDKPRVRIKFEFEGEDRGIEVEEHYPAGKVPAAYVTLQEFFFDSAFR